MGKMNWGKLRDGANVRRRGSESARGEGDAAQEQLVRQLLNKPHSPNPPRPKPLPFLSEHVIPYVPIRPAAIKIRCYSCGRTKNWRPQTKQSPIPTNFRCKKCGGKGYRIPKFEG